MISIDVTVKNIGCNIDKETYVNVPLFIIFNSTMLFGKRLLTFKDKLNLNDCATTNPMM